jgi:Mg/Co/Ni transporter MgtE
MAYTMEDFNRQYIKEHFPQLTPEEQREALARLSPEHRREVLRSLPREELLGALSAEQIREYLDRLTESRPEQPRRSRRKK